MAVVNDAPLLTLAQVKKWEARKAELDQQIRAAQEELVGITRNLDAASVFVRMKNGNGSAAPASHEDSAKDRSADEGFPDAVLRVAALEGTAFRPASLRDMLKKSGVNMASLEANPGYLYTVLGRLVQRGKLEKRRNGLYRVIPSTGSSKEETGAVAAPVRQ